MMFRRVATFFLTLVVSTTWLIPTATPASVDYAQTLGQGYSVAGDFKGAVYQQIATLYDPNDDLGLRIAVLDRTTTDPKMVATQCFVFFFLNYAPPPKISPLPQPNAFRI